MELLSKTRSFLVLITIPLLTILCSLAVIFGCIVLRISARGIQAVPRFWGRYITAGSGVSVKIEGLENLDPAKPYIFAGNHQSQFDIFVINGYLPVDFRWLAKKELFRIPFFGSALRLSGSIPVDRANGRQAVKSLEEAAQRIAAGTSVIIFPEGTRSEDGRLKPFKAGGMHLAIKSGVDLVPLAIIGSHRVMPKGKLLANPGRVLIRIGKPVKSSDYNATQKKELAELLHDRVAEMLPPENK